jgi:hypothetical protein
VLVVDPAKVQAVHPVTHTVTFTPGSQVDEGGELVATPVVADVTGDGRPEIVIGGQEEYNETPNIGDGGSVVGLLALAGGGGNSRLYVISGQGRDATASPPSAVHPDAQAYLPGWPVKVAQVKTNLLPTIGDGVTMPAVVGEVNAAHAGVEIVGGSAAGPLYVFGSDGHSVFGSTAAGDIPLLWAGGTALENAGDFGPNRNSNDLVASLLGFSGPVLADVHGDGEREILAPTAGLTRLLDLLQPDLQLPNDDQLSGWDGATRLALPGSPRGRRSGVHRHPAVVDIDGDGHPETLAGTSTYTLSAFDADGHAPAGWPKLTGGWSVGTPSIGDWDGDGHNEVAQPRRDGTVLVWRTAGTAAPAWAQWGCDLYHSGACVDTAPAALPPSPTTTTTTSTTAPVTSSTTAASDPATTLAASPTTAVPVTRATALPVTGATGRPRNLVGPAGRGVALVRAQRGRGTRPVTAAPAAGGAGIDRRSCGRGVPGDRLDRHRRIEPGPHHAEPRRPGVRCLVVWGLVTRLGTAACRPPRRDPGRDSVVPNVTPVRRRRRRGTGAGAGERGVEVEGGPSVPRLRRPGRRGHVPRPWDRVAVAARRSCGSAPTPPSPWLSRHERRACHRRRVAQPDRVAARAPRHGVVFYPGAGRLSGVVATLRLLAEAGYRKHEGAVRPRSSPRTHRAG